MIRKAKSALARFGWTRSLVAALVLINVCLGAYLLLPDSPTRAKGLQGVVDLRDKSFPQLSDYFSEVAEEEGAMAAYAQLRVALLPPGVDVHLLGHLVGDILYKQRGAEAITLCTDEFRNACSHTIVIGTLLEKGPGSFGEIADLCRRAPGGSGAYTMCFHGLGHGVLAYNEYELPLAVEMCKKTGDSSKGREYAECIGGAIMEMIAGVHDRQVWEAKAAKYFKSDDPLYPCTASFMDDYAKDSCFTYITPHLFEAAGADLAMPQAEHYEKAFRYCEKAPEAFKGVCFGGFGKEFVVLAQSRDIRAVGSAPDSALGLMHDWCALTDDIQGRASCVVAALNSLYWGGENDPDASVRFCKMSEERGDGGFCFDNLVGAVSYYVSDPAYRENICARLPEHHRNACRERLL